MSSGVLEGSLVRLEPLAEAHLLALLDAARDQSSFTYTLAPGDETAMAGYISELIAARDAAREVPFVQIRRADGKVVGMTRYLALRRHPSGNRLYAVEVGGTWLAPGAQRSGLNTEAKLLLLANAFDSWQVERVDLKTDARNAQSRAAIERLGTRFEGILRRWQPSQVAGEEHLLRDTAMYSLLAEEWPAARERLVQRLRAGAQRC